MRYRFAFNGKENDNEVKGTGNQLDFGARIYDPRLGRWLSLDPLAQKYPSMSPYNFGANNPILFIDPDGKEIRISYTAKVDGKPVVQTVKYENGKLKNLDGTAYKGNNAYLKTVQVQLSQLRLDDQETNRIVKDLQNSDNIHTISNVDKEGNVSDNKNQPIYTEDVNGGEIDEKSSHTVYNPWDSKDPSTNGKRNPRVALAHELKHAKDRDKGTLSDKTNEVGIEVDEVNAVKVENKVRAKTGDKQRTKYGGVEIPKKELK